LLTGRQTENDNYISSLAEIVRFALRSCQGVGCNSEG